MFGFITTFPRFFSRWETLRFVRSSSLHHLTSQIGTKDSPFVFSLVVSRLHFCNLPNNPPLLVFTSKTQPSYVSYQLKLSSQPIVKPSTSYVIQCATITSHSTNAATYGLSNSNPVPPSLPPKTSASRHRILWSHTSRTTSVGNADGRKQRPRGMNFGRRIEAGSCMKFRLVTANFRRMVLLTRIERMRRKWDWRWDVWDSCTRDRWSAIRRRSFSFVHASIEMPCG